MQQNDTRDILYVTRMITERLFKKNINFIKAGVMLSDFYDKGVSQSDMFIRKNRNEKDITLMKTIDRINSTGIGKVNFASQGIKRLVNEKTYALPSLYHELGRFYCG